jgi:cytochrome P450
MLQIPRIQDFADPAYDPFTDAAINGGEGGLNDIYAALARLRQAAPVQVMDIRRHFGLAPDITTADMRKVAVLGYQAVSNVLGDRERFSNSVYTRNLGLAFGRAITTLDAPEHGPLRQVLQSAFMKSALDEWGKTIVPRVINRLIDGFAQRGSAELAAEFTLHFPFHFIHEMLQLPLEDRAVFQKLAFAQVNVFFDRIHAHEAAEKLKTYLAALIAARRAAPAGPHDFIHALAGKNLPEDFLLAFFRQLMNAAGDTSFHGFSSVLTGLLTHPAQLAQVRQDRLLVTRAIEEGLRWNCPVPVIQRSPSGPMVLDGVELFPGERLDVVLAAANRDETVYAAPERFDIHRPPGRHLAFGYGAHVCLGQHLARLEMAAALNILLDRLPDLRLDEDFAPPVIDGLSLRGPHKLHVKFQPETRQ